MTGAHTQLTLTGLSHWLVAGHAFASTGGQCPVTVTLAQKSGNLHLLRVGHAHAVGFDDRGQLLSGRRFGIECKVRGDVGTGDVEYLDRDHRKTSTLIPECKVDAFLRHRHAANLSVDYHLERKHPIRGTSYTYRITKTVPHFPTTGR